MRMVFIIANDSNNEERFLTIGDLALLAIWTKLQLFIDDEDNSVIWNKLAINPGNYQWLSSVLCEHLLLSDLTNFGVWGDAKIVNKIDTNTNTMHKDDQRLPSFKDQKNMAKNTTLDTRKGLAQLHYCVNVRTRTHLGRVSAASWGVDAIRTVSAGDKDMFAKLAMAFDVHHLGHSNSANFIPYFSTNYTSNEQDIGLWGYVKRTSDRLAKDEISSGRNSNLCKSANIANTDVAAAAIFVSSFVNLGEVQAELDEYSKKRGPSISYGSSSKAAYITRSNMRKKVFQKFLEQPSSWVEKDGINDEQKPNATVDSGNNLKLKELWKFSSSSSNRTKFELMRGQPISILCHITGFLTAAVPDPVVNYIFDSASSSIRLNLKLLNDKEDGNKCSTGSTNYSDDNIIINTANINNNTIRKTPSSHLLTFSQSAKNDF